MFKKIKAICVTLGMFSLVAAPLAIPMAVSADTAGAICNGVGSTNSGTTGLANVGSNTPSDTCAGDASSSNQLQNILTLVVNIFSFIVGIIAVIMIIIGGIKYITSGGESSNVSGAKNTIIYAIIGLIIVALAQVLVHFVLAKTGSAVTGAQ